MRFLKILIHPVLFCEWAWKTILFYCAHRRKPVLSERLSGRPVNLADALLLTARFIERQKDSKEKWKIPLVEELEECSRGRESSFPHHIWALDGSRMWRRFRPSDGDMSAGTDFVFYAPQENELGHVYLIRHEFI